MSRLTLSWAALLSLSLGAAPHAAEPSMRMQMPQSAAPAIEPESLTKNAPADSQLAAGMPLSQFEEFALLNNPTLEQAAAQVAASRGKALQAGLWFNPTVGYIGDQIGAEGRAGELQGGFLQQTIVTGGKLRISRAKYRQEAVESEIRAMAQQLRVLNGVRTSFFEVLAIQKMVDLHRNLLENAEENLRTHREQANTGQANRAEVLLAEVEAKRARIALLKLENRHRAAWESLVAIAGVPDMEVAPVAGTLEPEGDPLDFDASLETLLRDSPELEAVRAHIVHDQIALRREQVQPIPNIELSANTGHNFETTNVVAGVDIGFQIPLWDRNQGSIQQARADLRRSCADVRRMELWLRQRLANVFSEYQTALESSEIHREFSIPKATEAYEIQLEMYNQRRTPWPEVIKLARNVLEVKEEYTQSLLELRKAEVAITGLLLVDGLSEPKGPNPGGHLEATPRPR